MNKPFLHIALFFISLLRFMPAADAQAELVPNGSFEEYTDCPQGTDELFLCVDWEAPTYATTDYCNECALNGNVDAPHYVIGYQYAFDGKGYVGIGVYYASTPSVSEYAQAALNIPLVKNHIYRISYRINLANHSVYTLSNFGAYISEQRPYADYWNVFKYKPQSVAPPITDTLKWTLVSDTLVAKGGEKYITFGRFDYNGPPQLQPVPPDTNPFYPDEYSYFLLDSVRMIETGEIPDADVWYAPNIFSPNGDGVNDIFYIRGVQETKTELHIYDRWGEEIFSTRDASEGWDGTYQNQAVNSGVYVYWCRIEYPDGSAEVKKGNISLIR